MQNKPPRLALLVFINPDLLAHGIRSARGDRQIPSVYSTVHVREALSDLLFGAVDYQWARQGPVFFVLRLHRTRLNTTAQDQALRAAPPPMVKTLRTDTKRTRLSPSLSIRTARARGTFQLLMPGS